MRVSGISHSVSFWIAVALTLLVVLQLPPIPGVYLMFFGAPFIAGLLVHLLLASLFIESLARRIPRALVAIPLLAYGAYYAACLGEAWTIHVAAGAVEIAKPEVALRLDPAEQSLVMNNARAFVADYDVPVAYQADAKVKPDGYESYRLLPRGQCAIARASRAMPGMTRLSPRDPKIADDGWSCLFATPEQPPLARLEVIKRGIDSMWARTPGITETGIDITLAGEPIASYRTGAYAWRLPSLPILFVGCWLIDNPPAWRCDAGFERKLTKVGRVDGMGDDKLAFALAADMLGLDKLKTADGHPAPRPAANLDALLAKLPTLPQPQSADVAKTDHADDRELFAAFSGFLAGETDRTEKQGSWTMLVVDGADHPSRELRDAVLLDPKRLGPYRDQMIAKLRAMRLRGVSQVSPWVELVASALAAMPKETFVSIPDDSLNSLLQYLRAVEGWRYGGLYVRTGDVGKRVLPFYSEDFVRYHDFPFGRENPALAICRIGETDDAARGALRTAYLKFLPGDPRKMSFNVVQYGSALFLALLASGDGQFLKDNPVSAADERTKEWYGLLLGGKGRVDGRPNNCVEIAQTPAPAQGQISAGLAWGGGHWTETAAATR